MKIDYGDLLTGIIGVLSFFAAVKAAKAAHSSSDAAIKLVEIENLREKRAEADLQLWIDYLSLSGFQFSVVNLGDRPGLIRNLEIKYNSQTADIVEVTSDNEHKQSWNIVIPPRGIKTFKVIDDLSIGENFDLLIYSFDSKIPFSTYIDSSQYGPYKIEI